MTTLTVYHFPMVSLQRSYPPVGYYDTVSLISGKLFSAHGEQTIFEDHEINHVNTCIGESSDLVIKINEMGKHLLQQQSTRGCTAAVAAMLLLDHGKEIDREALAESNLGDDSFILSSLQKGGLKTLCSRPAGSVDPLFFLKSALQTHGSAILTVDGDFGGHVVIVDHLYPIDGVRIREPYHGWDITLKTAAFLKYWQLHSPLIQIFQD